MWYRWYRAGRIHRIYLDPGWSRMTQGKCEGWNWQLCPGHKVLDHSVWIWETNCHFLSANQSENLSCKSMHDDTGWWFVSYKPLVQRSLRDDPKEALLRPPTPSDDAISMSRPCFALYDFPFFLADLSVMQCHARAWGSSGWETTEYHVTTCYNIISDHFWIVLTVHYNPG